MGRTTRRVACICSLCKGDQYMARTVVRRHIKTNVTYIRCNPNMQSQTLLLNSNEQSSQLNTIDQLNDDTSPFSLLNSNEPPIQLNTIDRLNDDESPSSILNSNEPPSQLNIINQLNADASPFSLLHSNEPPSQLNMIDHLNDDTSQFSILRSATGYAEPDTIDEFMTSQNQTIERNTGNEDMDWSQELDQNEWDQFYDDCDENIYNLSSKTTFLTYSQKSLFQKFSIITILTHIVKITNLQNVLMIVFEHQMIFR